MNTDNGIYNNAIHASNIEDIDTLNTSGTLDNMTFFSDNDTKIESSDDEILNKLLTNLPQNSSSDNLVSLEKEKDSDDNRFRYYSQYFILEEDKELVNNNICFKNVDFMKELLFIIFFYSFFGTNNIISDAISIDGIISCITFYCSYINIHPTKNVLEKNRMNTFDRYIYYIFLYITYVVVNYITWYKLAIYLHYTIPCMISPSIMHYIYHIS